MAREIKKRQGHEQTEEPPVKTDKFIIFEEFVNVLAEQKGIKPIFGEINKAVTPVSHVLPAGKETTARKKQKDL